MEFTKKIQKIEYSSRKIRMFCEITDLISVRKLIYKTIEINYSAYWNEPIVQYFKDFHHNDSIRNRAQNGNTFLYCIENRILGTGTLTENRLEAIFTDPAMQDHGIGKQILYSLMHLADNKGYDCITLESTPGSKSFFERFGFTTLYDHTVFVDDIYPLMHHIMEKRLH